jgi:hypothetical protein
MLKMRATVVRMRMCRSGRRTSHANLRDTLGLSLVLSSVDVGRFSDDADDACGVLMNGRRRVVVVGKRESLGPSVVGEWNCLEVFEFDLVTILACIVVHGFVR